MQIRNKAFVLFLFFSIFLLQIEKAKGNRKKGDTTLASNAIASQIIEVERPRVLTLADSLLFVKPITVTDSSCPRSAGGLHDYYSEATYWWSDPKNPNGSYIRKDGMNNPENFDNHLKAIGRFSWIVGTETSAYLLTGKKEYAKAAVNHLKAWFVDTTTLMHPHLLYAQAIKGINTGRGIGIIDAVSLIEVSKSVEILEKSPYLSKLDGQIIREWFDTFMIWMNTHPYGIDEMNAKNNHGTWWHAQVAAYAHLVGDTSILWKCRKHYVEILLPTQMAKDGSLPLELERTKPYSYSLFCLDGFATLAHILTTKDFDAWNFALPNGSGMKNGVDFIKPYVTDRNCWPYNKDISHWVEQPGRRPFMFFAAMAQKDPTWIKIWKENDPNFPSEESKRNMPLKNPILWVGLSYPIK
ncbi:MAG: alginate lyase family protein [Bacteroidales bacterium]|nr:alginate lyase family protein [Bacteroidales bacterium]